MEKEPIHFEFWPPDGTLRLLGRDDWREPICSVCHEPIQYVLDMMSFRNDAPGYSLAHARCVWRRDAFDREKLRAPSDEEITQS
jgi:hypothetical protein